MGKKFPVPLWPKTVSKSLEIITRNFQQNADSTCDALEVLPTLSNVPLEQLGINRMGSVTGSLTSNVRKVSEKIRHRKCGLLENI